MAIDINIKNHGDGTTASVTPDYQLKVSSENHELQHYMAITHGQTYQTEYIDTGITAKTQAIMHIKNTDPTRKMVLSYLRMQAITAGTYPSTGEMWKLCMNETYTSGGTLIIPTNTFQASGKSAVAEVYGNDPTLGGTAVVLDSQAPNSNGQEISYNKHGSIILGLNDTFTIKYTSASTGWAKARVTFVMTDEA